VHCIQTWDAIADSRRTRFDATLAVMRKDIIVDLGAADRIRLGAIIADRNSPQKHVWRAQIVLLTGAGHGTVEIMRRQEQNLRLALAGAVHDCRRKRAVA